MRLLQLALCLLVLGLGDLAQGGTPPQELYQTSGVHGAEDSTQYDFFTVPPGLKSMTLYVGHTTFGRAYISCRPDFGRASRVPAGREKPTVLYPVAGRWRIEVYGVTSYAGGNFRIVGRVDTQPLSRQAGTFSAFLGERDRILLTLTRAGAFTGRYRQGENSFVIRGRFDDEGNATSNAPVPYSLHINPVFNPYLGGNNIGGTVAGSSFTAFHTAFAPKARPFEMGRYTVLLAPNEAGTTIPQGTGYGTLRVGRGGATMLSGRLPDGTKVSAAGPLYGSVLGQLQFHLSNTTLYGRKGRLSGAITFREQDASSADGTLHWMKPATTAAYYPEAFATTVQGTATPYGARARGLRALDFPARTQNATITLSGGGLAAAITEVATLAGDNRVTVEGPNPQQVKLKLNSAAGTFSGTFLHPASGREQAFAGALYQSDAAPVADGFFLGPVQEGAGLSGGVRMTPR